MAFLHVFCCVEYDTKTVDEARDRPYPLTAQGKNCRPDILITQESAGPKRLFEPPNSRTWVVNADFMAKMRSIDPKGGTTSGGRLFPERRILTRR
jgi:hypothetical protein